MKYILVYDVNGYPEEGGGTYYEEFDTIQSLDNRVSEIMTDKQNTLVAAGEFKPYEYKAVEYITKIERK